jgi:hypothetical protein
MEMKMNLLRKVDWTFMIISRGQIGLKSSSIGNFLKITKVIYHLQYF